ncbi:hypothetical protein ambt_15145 [Alteromonas naphthalenivorans]|uniref:Uncharacterized protein n=1 Tax=Alteromonas naphthalenivorans TaxID=715451 RepID=F5Z4X2_ALTNA|nr:hypothetical protein ambt_15145 [Alteromonas naphthalenivorans]
MITICVFAKSYYFSVLGFWHELCFINGSYTMKQYQNKKVH